MSGFPRTGPSQVSALGVGVAPPAAGQIQTSGGLGVGTAPPATGAHIAAALGVGAATPATGIATVGPIDISTVGNGLQVAEGANAKQGLSGAMTAGAITVANTSVTANSRIMLTRQDGGTNPGACYVSARVAGTSFSIASTNAADTGQVAYQIFEPG